MKVLVIGQGGREHAIIKSISQSASVIEMHAIPGSSGIAREALCHDIPLSDTEALIQFCLRKEIDYVFVGPEDPLVDGLADALRERGILVVGPGKEAAQLEGSKIFAKKFMQEAGVPTSDYQIVDSVATALAAAKNFTPPYVLKADGLAAGKGVFICDNLNDLQIAAENIFDKKILGKAGERALLEQFMPGWELSFLILTNGEDFTILPLAQDHKRLCDGQSGPNTGGMGTVAPLKIEASLMKKITDEIAAPSVALLHKKQLIYRGILFIGVMITDRGPQVLEYNVRLGDPETQVILPLIENDTAVLFKNLAQGKLLPIQYKNLFSCCVVLAAEGYPDNSVKGTPIEGDILSQSSSSYFIHAGTRKESEQHWVTHGGRVIGALGIGSNLEEAIVKAYDQAAQVSWRGRQMRTDIGKYFTKTNPHP